MLLIGGSGSCDLPLIGGSGSRDPHLIGGNMNSSELFAESSPYWEKHVKDVLNSTRFLVRLVFNIYFYLCLLEKIFFSSMALKLFRWIRTCSQSY